MSWVPRAGLHLLASVGATGVFAAAAVAGAHQAPTAEPPQVQAPGRAQADTQAAQRPRPSRAPRERSVAGTVRETRADGMVVIETLRGQELQVQPLPGALIRLNGKASALDGLQTGDRVVILGQAQPRARMFLAHAITARRPRAS